MAEEAKRIDLTVLKDRLNSTLGKDAAYYWEYLKRFLRAKISKPELDYYVKKLLGSKLFLHNFIIRSILGNAHSNVLPKGYTSSKKRSRLSSLGLEHTDQKENQLVKRHRISAGDDGRSVPYSASAVQAPVDVGGKRVYLSAVPVPGTSQKPSVWPSHVPVELQRPLGWGVSTHSSVCDGGGPGKGYARASDLPSLSLLKGRMQQTAIQYGLEAVSDDAVRLVHDASRLHLEEIIASCLRVTRIDGSDSEAGRMRQTLFSMRRRILHARDLQATIEVIPDVLGEDLPVSQERVNNAPF